MTKAILSFQKEVCFDLKSDNKNSCEGDNQRKGGWDGHAGAIAHRARYHYLH
jgi:hypothetical protein